MENRDIAMEFLRRFCAGDIEGLAPLMAEDLRFNGPLRQFRSRDAYLDSLRGDPPEPCGYRVLSVTEGGDHVSIYYEYEKRDRVQTMAQLCRLENQVIREILLVFDGRGFT